MTAHILVRYFLPATLITLLILAVPALAGESNPVAEFTPATSLTPVFPADTVTTEVSLYQAIGLQGIIPESVFAEALKGFQKIHPDRQILALADFSQASTSKRFVVVDLQNKKMLFHSYVAHGKNSGENWATKFSNTPESYQSSLGFYLTGPIIQSPKHGPALLLNGLEKGFNDNARAREIIMHAADYVSESFVSSQGRLGRSYGCPALPADINEKVINTIKDGCVLFIYGNDDRYLAQSQYLRD